MMLLVNKANPIEINLEASPVEADAIVLRPPLKYMSELTALMEPQGIQYTARQEFGSSEVFTVGLVISNAAFLLKSGGLKDVIIKFMERHKDKKVELTATSTAIQGFDADDVQKILKAANDAARDSEENT